MATLTLRREDGRIVCERVVVADRAHRRMRGLLGRKYLRQGEGMVLRPGWSIHTAFMRFPIDAVFLDADQVVIKIEHEVGPWRTVSCRGAREVVELSAGECQATRTRGRRPRGVGLAERRRCARGRRQRDVRRRRRRAARARPRGEPRSALSPPRPLPARRPRPRGRRAHDARAPPRSDPRAEASTSPSSTAPMPWRTRCAPRTLRARGGPRCPWSSPRTRAERARRACACSIAGTRPRSCSSTSSDSSPSALAGAAPPAEG